MRFTIGCYLKIDGTIGYKKGRMAAFWSACLNYALGLGPLG